VYNKLHTTARQVAVDESISLQSLSAFQLTCADIMLNWKRLTATGSQLRMDARSVDMSVVPS